MEIFFHRRYFKLAMMKGAWLQAIERRKATRGYCAETGYVYFLQTT